MTPLDLLWLFFIASSLQPLLQQPDEPPARAPRGPVPARPKHTRR